MEVLGVFESVYLAAAAVAAEGEVTCVLAVGCRIVVAAKSDDAFDGRRVAFLIHPAHGLFELVEAYGGLKPSMPGGMRTSTNAIA